MKVLWLSLPVLLPSTASQSAHSAHATSVTSAHNDSVRVVAAGVRALGGKHAAQWRVSAFTRDSTGIVISLIPPCPKGLACAGGGGRVRVWSNSRVSVLERYR
jgi:hypothetical protein